MKKKETNKVSRSFEGFLEDLNIQLSQVQYFCEDKDLIICITKEEIIWVAGKKASVRKEEEETSQEYIVETEEGTARAFRQYKVKHAKEKKSIVVDDVAPVKEYKVQRSAIA